MRFIKAELDIVDCVGEIYTFYGEDETGKEVVFTHTLETLVRGYEQLYFVLNTLAHLYPDVVVEWDFGAYFLIPDLDQHQLFDLDIKLLSFQFANRIQEEQQIKIRGVDQ